MCYHVVDQRIEQTPSTKNSFATTAMLKPVISWAAGLRVSAGLQALQLEPWICLDTMFPWRILHPKGECVFSFLQLKAAKEQKRTPKIDADQDDDESVGAVVHNDDMMLHISLVTSAAPTALTLPVRMVHLFLTFLLGKAFTGCLLELLASMFCFIASKTLCFR